ncbi:hypothetical protein A5672_22960 [Mycobacterium alsense]|uniref:PPE family protein n=1 Tax=Mycobacterium alsense TaxID=324058 RepID=A0ABD6NXD2_9MYCO|nr:PPE family protein [Mycobacterium alsense]OBG34365.1 hypothetical protein A5672_22960 [Mycobacterium alsense]
MTFDFGAFPPELNSARMYAGPGSGPMMAAAAAWNNLADELSTTALASQSLIAQLADDEWTGPSSAAMVTAATPYVAWMHTTAGQLQRAAAQAMASAAAYQAAFAMTVPPPVVAANRAQLAALVATNILGQNTPAIAATEALYGEMWAQDAAAMYGYAAASAASGTLDPLTSPAPPTNPAGLGAQAAAVSHAAASGAQTAGLSGLVSNLPNAVQAMATPAAATPVSPLANFLNNNLVYNAGQAIADNVAWNMFASIAAGILNQQASAATGPIATAGSAGSLANTAAPAAGAGGAPVLAGMGTASPLGKLSVPAAWSAATPAEPAATVLAGSGWAAPTEETAMTPVPAGMPAMATAGRGGYAMGPRYGVQPKVMPTQTFV